MDLLFLLLVNMGELLLSVLLTLSIPKYFVMMRIRLLRQVFDVIRIPRMLAIHAVVALSIHPDVVWVWGLRSFLAIIR